MKKSDRTKGFWFSSTPLTSRKGSLVISDFKQSEVLVKAVRATRSAELSVSKKIDFDNKTKLELMK